VVQWFANLIYGTLPQQYNNTSTISTVQRMSDTGKEDDTDDPFACFDIEDDSIDGETEHQDDVTGKEGVTVAHSTVNDFPTNDQMPVHRDPNCGVLAFHSGTEIALLHHVKMMRLGRTTTVAKKNDDYHLSLLSSLKSASEILNWIDDFCLQRHWMMHIGKEKGEILKNFVVECLSSRNYKSSPSSGSMGSSSNGDIEAEAAVSTNRVVFVELGTYCGYSAIFMAKTILEFYSYCDKNVASAALSSPPSSSLSQQFKIYSVEVVEQHAKIAKELIHLSGMEHYIDVILIDQENNDDNAEGTSSLTTALQNHLLLDQSSSVSSSTESGTAPVVDFLFVDHDKDLYLQDLQRLERVGLIRTGTYVAADNVVFAHIDNYCRYMTYLSQQGIVQTRLVESLVEYSQPDLDYSMMNMKKDNRPSSEDIQVTKTPHRDILKDGIELSVYLRDPVSFVPPSSKR
jgi:catechol O-methyltransferase